MTRKQRRLALIGLALGGLAVATGLALYALSVLSDTIVYFKTPSDLFAQPVAPATRLRLGGLVEKGSLVKLGGTRIDFAITDTAKSIKVSYDGILPDLFREGEGVVAEGRLDAAGVFQADSVLAKHDEKYMPPEVAEALKKQGVWKGGGSN